MPRGPLPDPPRAPRRPHAWERAGRRVPDDLAWMRDHDDPDLRAYLEAENAYAEQWLAPLQPLQDRLFEEVRGFVCETDDSAPVRRGQWVWWDHTDEGSQYHQHWRRLAADPGAPPELLLDENVEAAGKDYFELGGFDPSPSGRWFTWLADVDGSETFELRVRDAATGVDRDDRITGVVYGTAWSLDERYVFYVRPDAAWRPYQVWRHELGADPATDACVFEEPDERFWMSMGNDRRGDRIVVHLASRTTGEAWLLDAGDPLGSFRVVAARRDGVEYEVEPQGDRLLIVTNLDAVDFRLMEAPAGTPDWGHWRELIGHRPGVRLLDVDAFEGWFAVHEMEAASTRVRIVRPDAELVLAGPAEVGVVAPGPIAEFVTDTYRIVEQTPVTPPTTVDVDVASGARAVVKVEPVPGWSAAGFECRREWAVAADGTRIPVSVAYRRGLRLDGSHPCVLVGYGSYEISTPPRFSWVRLPYLTRGVVFAIAHVRGGGEMGRAWYEGGRLLDKVNTFTDWCRVAEHLAEAGYTSPGRLAVSGGSAGGLLVGAGLARRPDLFRAVVAAVPFVDNVTTMHDETLPLTVGERDEWGDPRQSAYDEAMTAYSPYENVTATDHPALFVTAGVSDPRVGVQEPAKWVARLRAVAGPVATRPLLLRTEMVGGHFGPSGRYEAWRDEARHMAFVLEQIGVEA